MQWPTLLLLFIALLAILWFRQSGQMPAKDAVEMLKRGALIIDVRTGTEFSDEHLPHAINIPLDRIEELLPERVLDKRQPLLLHCHSGMRSSLARKKMLKMGYTRVFNLGSYTRASSLVKAAL
jgi:phage shock protein E